MLMKNLTYWLKTTNFLENEALNCKYVKMYITLSIFVRLVPFLSLLSYDEVFADC